SDITQIQATIPGVDVTVPTREVRDFIWHQQQSVDGKTEGTVSWFPEMRNRTVTRGRFFTTVEVDSRDTVCVLTESLARRLFPLGEPVGKTVRVNRSYFRVIGLIEDERGLSGSGPDTGEADSNEGLVMLIPITTLNEHFGETIVKFRSGSFEAVKVAFHEVTIFINDPNKVMAAADAIRHVLELNHEDKDWSMTVPLDLLQRAERTKQIFNIVLGSIAAISLIVGGIGIMNIMLATVTERTREIGIRRALGAKQKDIVSQFLIETILLSGAGGLIGVALGLAIPVIITQFADMLTIIRVWAPTLAFTISVMTGVLFGIYPAIKAAKMNPVDALRHE
ncbi:MAG: ABC transporter permease, partial [Verrucomicrobiota bacterium]